MALGLLEISGALPIRNRRALVDSDGDGVPDGWGYSGNAKLYFRKGSVGDLWGLTNLCGLALEVAAGAYVECFTPIYSVPRPNLSGSFVVRAEIRVRCYPGQTGTRLRLEITSYTAAGVQVATSAGSTGLASVDWAWSNGSATLTISTNDVAYVSLRLKGYNSAAANMVIDAPSIHFSPLAGASPEEEAETLQMTPSVVVASPLERVNDAFGGAYHVGTSGMESRKSYVLNYVRCTDADYGAWLRAWNLNQGASGLVASNGSRILGCPVHVNASVLVVGAASTDAKKVSAMQSIHCEGHIREFGLRQAEYPGWGYSGRIILDGDA